MIDMKIIKLEDKLFEALRRENELLEALKPFSYLAKVMKEGEYLTHRGVYVSWEQAQAASAAVEKATAKDGEL